MAISQHLMQDSTVRNNEPEWVTQTLLKPLPAVTDSASELLKSPASKQLSYQAVSAVLGKDPVLALAVVNEANRGTGTGEGIVKTLQQALGLLGMDFVEDQLRQVQPLKRSDAGAMEYCQSLATSYCAAHLAKEIARIRLPGREEELFWTALLHGVPMWYLWHWNTDKMQRWEHTINKPEPQRPALEVSIFSTHFVDVWHTIHATFSLPDSVSAYPLFSSVATKKVLIGLARHCPLRGTPRRPQSRQQMLLLNNPGFIVGLSNLIAFRAKHSPHSDLFRKLCQVLATLLKKPLQDTLAIVHKSIVNSARQHPLPWGHAIVEQMIWGPPLGQAPGFEAEAKSPSVSTLELPQAAPEEKTTTPAIPLNAGLNAAALTKSTVAETASTIPQAEQSAASPKQALKSSLPAGAKFRSGNKKLFAEITEAMLRTPAEFNTTSRLMNGASRCITYGIGLQTSVVAIINQQRSRLKGYYATGTGDRPDLAKIDIDLTVANIFQTLMQRPSGIWVKPESSAKVHKMIPEQFTSINKTSDFFLMSCFMKNQPVALFYADAGTKALPLTAYEYDCFKKVCSAVSQVLVYKAQTVKTNAG